MIVLRAADRFRSDHDGIQSRHCFSAGAHYDPDNTHFGPLIGCDEHRVVAGSGFSSHPHAGVVIVSWPLAGRLVHQHDGGPPVEIAGGGVGVLVAGAGVDHSERAGADHAVRFLQMTLLGDPAQPVHYCRYPVADAGEVLTVATAQGRATLRVIEVAEVSLRAGHRRFAIVAHGTATLGAIPVVEGDSVRIAADEPLTIRADAAGQVLVWDLP